VNEGEKPQNLTRPYFLPEEIDFDTLPEAVRAALNSIVAPAYQNLVITAPNPLERSMGVSFVFLLTEEILTHFELGRQMALDRKPDDDERRNRERELSQYLRLLSAKTSALHALLRLRKLPPLARYSPSTA
jgi:hypothetical protein